MKPAIVKLLATALGFWSAVSAQAGMTQIDVSWYGDYSARLVAQGYNHLTSASAIKAQRVGGDEAPTGHSNPFVTFCLDVNNVTADGWWAFGSMDDTLLTAQSPGAQRQEESLYRVANLYSQFSSGILDVGNNMWVGKKQGAALQLAIWEVLYENPSNGYSLNQEAGSGFYVTEVDEEVRGLANLYLSSAWTQADKTLATTFWNAANEDGSHRASQDLIGPMMPVPEPASIIAGALLLLPFLASTAARMRRR